MIEKLLKLFEIGSVDEIVSGNCLSSDIQDFENTVLYQEGMHHLTLGIVTRDRQGFKKGTLLVYSSEELLNSLTLLENG